MSGEPEPAAADDKLNKALTGLMFIWLGLVLGLLLVSGALAVTVVMLGEATLDMPELGYGALVLVPVALVGAFVIAPMVIPTDPEKVGPYMRGPGGVNPWVGTPPDDPYYWFPVYSPLFFVRIGILEWAAITMAVLFLVTATWALLAGIAVLAAAMFTQMPTRAKYHAWLEDVRRRRSGEPGG
jgi:hypothetical protein